MTRQSIAARALLSGVTLLVITMGVYAGVRALPGTPAWGDDADARPNVQGWLERQHASDPLPIGYLRWLADLARLDLGISLSVQPGRPVIDLIGAALPSTCILSSLAILITLGVAIPLGGHAAARSRSPVSRVISGLLYVLHALPVFVVALLLQHVVAGRMGILPALGPPPERVVAQAAGAWLFAAISHWVLPVLTLTVGSLAFAIRFCRTVILEGLEQRWAEAARARGAHTSRVLRRHALLHAAFPLISLFGLMLPGVIGGSVMIEHLFALPGMGRLFFTAVGRCDYPVVMAVSLLVATATILAGFVSDALYRVVDPRLRGPRDQSRLS